MKVEDLSEAERAYYRATWGFDPVADKIKPPPPGSSTLKVYSFTLRYSYEALIPLENDPELQEIDITVHARVDVDDQGNSHNSIEFRRNGRTFPVFCVHAVFYSAPIQEVLSLSEEDLVTKVTTTEGQPALLPPWEHFAALKSYVAGIASVGFFELYRQSHSPEVPKESSFIFTMPAQINEGLLEVAPDVLHPLMIEIFGSLLDQVPARWIIDRWEYFEESGILSAIGDLKFLDSLDFSCRKKALEIFLALYQQGVGYLEVFQVQILPVLLTEEFLDNLEIPLQYEIMESLVYIVGNYSEEPKLGPLLYNLFSRAIKREDKSLLDYRLLRKIDYTLWVLENHQNGTELFEEISQGYLRSLIMSFISIWKDFPEYLPSSILYFLLEMLLDTDEDPQLTHEILQALNDQAPFLWAQQYLNMLAEDYGRFPEFTRNDFKWTDEDMEDTDGI